MEENVAVSRTHNKIPAGIVVGFFVIVAVSAFAPASWFGAAKKPLHSKLDLSVIAEPGSIADDVDHDGEISWKELAMTGLGIDPAEAESVTIEMEKEDLDTLNDPNNLTSSFSKNMYVAALAIQQQGGMDEESKQKIVDQLMAEEAGKMSSRRYSIGDIIVVQDNSRESLKKYGNGVAGAIQDLITKDAIIDTLASVDAYTNKGYAEDLLPLQKRVQATVKAMEKLRAVKVPQMLVSQHLNLLNSYEAYKDMLTNLAAIEHDALRSTLAIKKYDEVLRRALRERLLIVTTLKAQDVTFSSSEAGFAFMAGYTN